jgi:hypothetical protein
MTAGYYPGQWSMCGSLCPYESVTPNPCSWGSLRVQPPLHRIPASSPAPYGGPSASHPTAALPLEWDPVAASSCSFFISHEVFLGTRTVVSIDSPKSLLDPRGIDGRLEPGTRLDQYPAGPQRNPQDKSRSGGSRGDIITPSKIQPSFQINHFFEQKTKTLVKEIRLARRVRPKPSDFPLRGKRFVVIRNPADWNPCFRLAAQVFVDVK